MGISCQDVCELARSHPARRVLTPSWQEDPCAQSRFLPSRPGFLQCVASHARDGQIGPTLHARSHLRALDMVLSRSHGRRLLLALGLAGLVAAGSASAATLIIGTGPMIEGSGNMI